jgi:hypothetical protein
MKARFLIILLLTTPTIVFARVHGETDSSLPDLSQMAAYLSLLLVVVLFIYVFSRRNKRHRISRETYDDLYGQLFSDLRFALKDLFDKQKDQPGNNFTENQQIADLKKRIMELELAQRVKERPDVPFEVVRPAAEQTAPEPAAPVAKEAEPAEIFYLSTPNSDGSFNIDSVHQVYRPSASIYRFKKTKANKARFHIDERETSVRMALRYPDKSIDPACEALNGFNPNAKKIITKPGNEGEAELTGDKWVVTRKAKISYE